MKIIFFLKSAMIFFIIVYFIMLFILFETTNYSFYEIDEDNNKVISLLELNKYFDTNKRYKCINFNKIIYLNEYPTIKCNKVLVEYFSLKDGIEFRVIEME